MIRKNKIGPTVGFRLADKLVNGKWERTKCDWLFPSDIFRFVRQDSVIEDSTPYRVVTALPRDLAPNPDKPGELMLIYHGHEMKIEEVQIHETLRRPPLSTT